jgi:sugar phosphate permease
MTNRGFHWAWVILAVCFVDLFVNYSIRLGFGVLLPEMIRAFDINRTQGGAILNVYLAAYLCVTPFTGNLTDRLGPRRVIALFTILLGTGTVLLGTADSFWMACLFFGLAGIGASGMWVPVLTTIQRWFAARRRGMALGIISAGYGLGFAVMGLVFPVLVSAFSWRFCWYLMGALALIMVLVNGTLLRSSPRDMGLPPWGEQGDAPAKQGSTRPAEKGQFRQIFRTAPFWIVGCSYMLSACALYIITTFLVDYAHGELGLSFEDASFLATIHGVSQLVGVLTLPMLSDRIGRRRTLMITSLLVAASIAGIMLSGKERWGLYASVAVLGFAYGPTWPMYGACAGDYFSKEVIGTVIGGWTPLYGLGCISAHFIGGRVRDLTQSFHGAFLAAIVLALMAGWVIGRLKRPAESA